jgi:hypothetical protein
MISFRESQLKRVLENLDKPTEVDEYGNKFWKNKEGQLHRRNDKPAVEYSDGTKHWYINGKIHRENDKPAVEHSDGKKAWYINGKFIKQNYGGNGIIHNDKFFDCNGNEIIGE